MAAWIDLNSDLGEGRGRWTLGDDSAMLDIVSSANVACGFHAGDPSIMRAICQSAALRGVCIGAHVSYDDLAGFGRRFIDVKSDELRDIVTYQIGALDAFARAAGTRVGYVKPHGALYNAIVDNDAQAEAVAAGVAQFGPLPMVGLAQSRGLEIARAAGLRIVDEAFADRAYNRDGTLVSRQIDGAILTDPDEIAVRAVRMVIDGQVESIDGATIEIHPSTICTHGDTPGSVAIAVAVRQALLAAGIEIRPFAHVAQ